MATTTITIASQVEPSTRAACAVALLRSWLQTPMGAYLRNEAGFVALGDALAKSRSLRGLVNSSESALADAVLACHESDLELDPKGTAVRMLHLATEGPFVKACERGPAVRSPIVLSNHIPLRSRLSSKARLFRPIGAPLLVDPALYRPSSLAAGASQQEEGKKLKEPASETLSTDSEPEAEAGPVEEDAASSTSGSREALAAETPESPEERPQSPCSASPTSTASPSSWAELQRRRRLAKDGDGEEDQEVARAIKSILNKLTVEKFEALSQKLLGLDFRGKKHMELLIKEVFEKATTQHHFVDMYADLCVVLHNFFTEQPMEDDTCAFKRILMNECQASFERNMEPPATLKDLDQEERIIQETKYKIGMVGNIRLVGALLIRRLIPTKVMLAIFLELLDSATPESLEAAAALMTVVGPTFDTRSSPLRSTFTGIFARMRNLAFNNECEHRARCLLKDVLELRERGWQNQRPKQQECPKTLKEVAEQAALAESMTPKHS